MDLFFQLLANGLVTGTFYALSALGLTLVFGLMRVVNFAHGELYVIGGLLGWALTAVLGWNYFLTLLVVIAVLGVGGYLIDQILIARVRGQGPAQCSAQNAGRYGVHTNGFHIGVPIEV